MTKAVRWEGLFWGRSVSEEGRQGLLVGIRGCDQGSLRE